MKIHLILIISFIICFQKAFSQKELPLNNPIYDNSPYHFGFTIGISNNKFQIKYGEAFIHQNNSNVIYDQILSKYEPGFNVGIIMDLRISNNSNLRITPSFNFTDQKLYFVKNNIENTYPENTGISNFEIPVYIKYRSDRVNNGRAYLLLGGNFMLDMTASEQLSQTQSLEFYKTNYAFEIGFGVDMYFAFFKFAPEIKYSHGLKNMLTNQNNTYNNLVNSLSTRSILISLTFE